LENDRMAAQNSTRRPLKSRNAVWAAGLARWLAKAGVSPNQISLASVAAAAIAGCCLLRGSYLAAALFIQLRLLCNLMDGMVAIEGGLRSAAGEIYNDLPDRISDALILLAAGYSLSWPAYGRELGWTATLLALMTAYVRTLGGACGLAQDFRGPMAKPQRMAVMTAACLLALLDSRAIALALIAIIAGALVTAVLRVRGIILQLETR
jgi:phosphatidylglycerophosphate synthase